MQKLIVLAATLAVVLLTQIFSQCLADEIEFSDGRTITGKIVEYKGGYIKIQKQNGKLASEKVSKIKHIVFDSVAVAKTDKTVKQRVSPKIRREINALVKQGNKALKTKRNPGAAIVVMYLDSLDTKDSIPRGIGYQCGSDNYGYSGSARVPFRKAWSSTEIVNLRRAGQHRVQLDPGPPFERMNLEIDLVEGKVTNLGRIMLRKAPPEGESSIYGTVRDFTGGPMPGVEVSANNRKIATDENGDYQIDGFGVDRIKLKASKQGYFGNTATVSFKTTNRQQVRQDLLLVRPQIARFSYVISSANDDSFVGSEIERGDFEITIDPFKKKNLLVGSSLPKNLLRFFGRGDLYLIFQTGELRFVSKSSSIRFQEAAPGVEFESIEEGASKFLDDWNSQRCPSLKDGSVLLIRSRVWNRNQGKAGSKEDRYLKLLVEKISVNE